MLHDFGLFRPCGIILHTLNFHGTRLAIVVYHNKFYPLITLRLTISQRKVRNMKENILF